MAFCICEPAREFRAGESTKAHCSSESCEAFCTGEDGRAFCADDPGKAICICEPDMVHCTDDDGRAFCAGETAQSRRSKNKARALSLIYNLIGVSNNAKLL